MPFGIPGTDAPSGQVDGKFLGRIQFDARVGYWKTVKRVQDVNGSWSDQVSDDFKNPTLVMDFASFEIGWIKFTGTPVFLVAGFGRPVPTCPDETFTDNQGKVQRAYKLGFRLKVASSEVFGDRDAYYFTATAKNILTPIDELFRTLYWDYTPEPPDQRKRPGTPQISQEALAGLVPKVACTGTKKVTTTSSFGTQTFHSPEFKLVEWLPRPACFGEQLVVLPGATANGHAAPSAPTGGSIDYAKASEQAKAAMPGGHVPPANKGPVPESPIPF